jgi:DNA modification methylase
MNPASVSYADFLATKVRIPGLFGVEPAPLPAGVFADFQAAVVRWAIKRGRAALFLDTGLGKSRCQLEWLRQSGARGLLVAPIAVGEQTIREARSLGLFGDNIRKVADPTGAPGVDVTNYEKLHRFVDGEYDAIVCDESSILKSIAGETRTMLIERFTRIPRRLCCSATPAPNDVVELANHAEFLGVMSRTEMLASFFTHDSERSASGGYRLKGHAKEAFWRWVARWAAYVRKPSDTGFDDGAFQLPRLTIREESVRADWKPDGMLFGTGLGGIGDRREARRATLEARVAKAAAIINDSRDQWLVWCGLNDEGDAIEKTLGEQCVQIAGADSEDERIAKEVRWRSGGVRVLVTKVPLFGFGLNWQHCHRMLFLGLGDSFEQYYQAIRRCWRFGQKHPVEATVVVSDAEVAVVENIRRKETEAAVMAAGVVEHARDVLMEEIGGKGELSPSFEYATRETNGDSWRLLLGDCVERTRDIPSDSIGLAMFSPPFSSLYTYSASERDMGNTKDDAEFFAHFRFLIPELRRIIMPGRTVVVHCQDLASTKTTHGYIGKRDFSGEIIRAFTGEGWVYDGRITVDKDPQAAAIRSKSKQLLFVQKERDSNWLMACLPDYLLRFRDPRDNAAPVRGDVTNDEWISWARPIWYGIRESGTLNAASARSDADEKHIAALQLETIERCVRLWTNKGDTVFSPFAGIGSEGVVALRNDRRFVGVELKDAYFKQAAANLSNAKRQLGLFGGAA